MNLRSDLLVAESGLSWFVERAVLRVDAAIVAARVPLDSRCSDWLRHSGACFRRRLALTALSVFWQFAVLMLVFPDRFSAFGSDTASKEEPEVVQLAPLRTVRFHVPGAVVFHSGPDPPPEDTTTDETPGALQLVEHRSRVNFPSLE